MSIDDSLKNSRTGQFWLKHEQKIILAIGIILIAAVSFEAGFLKGQKGEQEPVIVNKVSTVENAPRNECPAPATIETKNPPSSPAIPASTGNITATDNQKCAFVASKNSNKYHLPTCQFAQKIKSENKICFSSTEEAQNRGYLSAKCCIK